MDEMKMFDDVVKTDPPKRILCFCILRDLIPLFNPEEYRFSTKDELVIILQNLWKELEKLDFISQFFQSTHRQRKIKEVVENLEQSGYCVWNQYEKYFVIAFALDYKRFWIWCKNQIPQVIQWRKDDIIDPIENNCEIGRVSSLTKFINKIL